MQNCALSWFTLPQFGQFIDGPFFVTIRFYRTSRILDSMPLIKSALYRLHERYAAFGNEARHPGGKVIAFATDAGRDTVRKVTASETARMLDVTPGRVTQMIDAGLLTACREGHRTWVSDDSAKARLAESPKAGRPKKTAMA